MPATSIRERSASAIADRSQDRQARCSAAARMRIAANSGEPTRRARPRQIRIRADRRRAYTSAACAAARAIRRAAAKCDEIDAADRMREEFEVADPAAAAPHRPQRGGGLRNTRRRIRAPATARRPSRPRMNLVQRRAIHGDAADPRVVEWTIVALDIELRRWRAARYPRSGSLPARGCVESRRVVSDRPHRRRPLPWTSRHCATMRLFMTRVRHGEHRTLVLRSPGRCPALTISCYVVRSGRGTARRSSPCAK